jgi:GH25 family lysozyme M1 (1,4-beta-N-acetylmuramidase)
VSLGIDFAWVDRDAVDWRKVRDDKIAFAYIRAMWSDVVDPTYHQEAQRARDVGVLVGPYFFPDESVNAKHIAVQVAAFCALVKANEHVGDMPAGFDVEYARGVNATGRSRKELLTLIVDIAERLHVGLGYWPVLYSSARVIDGQDTDALDATRQGVDMSPLKNCPFWCSRYITGYRKAPVLGGLDALPWPPLPAYLGGTSNVWIRQTQGDAVGLPGVSGTVDINEFFALKLGSMGARVSWTQKRVGTSESGDFDHATELAVKQWQASRELEADGIVGPASFSLLARMS